MGQKYSMSTELVYGTKGLTNRNEICVINNIGVYNFNINRSSPPRVVERPYYPPLAVGEPGFIQSGMTEQAISAGGAAQNFGPNRYELIEHGRYNYVKELMGYVGAKTDEYDIYRVVAKATEIPYTFIDCGSSTSIDIGGTVYLADTGIGGLIENTLNHIAESGILEPIYQTARIGGGLSWTINTNQNASYKVRLRFADFYNIHRSFDIYINGIRRKQGFDVVGTIQKPFARIDLSFEVPVTQNKIELLLSGNAILNAIDVYGLDKSDIEFIEGTRDDQVENKDIYLFVNKNIIISTNNLKKKFLEVQSTTLQSRNKFYY
jgi:hypothetical protein